MTQSSDLTVSAAADQRFYSRYRWTINPVLSLQDLLLHLKQELDAREDEPAEADHLLQERRINCYLFACGIASVLDDYLGQQRMLPFIFHHPLATTPTRTVQWLWNAPFRLRSYVADSSVRKWRDRWSNSVDAACEALLGTNDSRFTQLAREALRSSEEELRGDAMRMTMRIPEGFRCQDLAHQDVFAMVNHCLPSLPSQHRRLAVIGPRTAGAYFAPLAAAYLRSLGYARVDWITVRPKTGFSSPERHEISRLTSAGAAILVIDDHQNSGNTMRLLVSALRALKVEYRHILIAVPEHPSNRGWTLPEECARGVRIFALPHEDIHKAHLLAERSSSTLAEYFEASGWKVQQFETSETASINAAFAHQCGDGFQVRLKRIFEIRQENQGKASRVLAKSVGWGWLAYHAWITASSLEGFVPRPIALRDGFLFCEWIEGQSLAIAPEGPEPIAVRLGAYIGRRTTSLPLTEDPWFRRPRYQSGWNELIAVLRKSWGRNLGRLKSPVLRRWLRDYRTPQPALVDGRMRPGDWIRSGNRLLKTDFEQHNFGGGEMNLVDSAWDLAAAVFEFELPDHAEARLLESYVEKTGDADVSDRFLLFKILYSTSVIRASKYWLARRPKDERRHELNARYIGARNFAAFHMARYCGRKLPPTAAAWTNRLVFLDLDGVLDWEFLGFPHTTLNGIRALHILQQAGFSIVLNTARSVAHVREYCDAYHLPGGIAECGSVFWNAVRGHEISLIDPDCRRQLRQLRSEIDLNPELLTDPTHEYSVRAYRSPGSKSRFALREIKPILARADYRNLACTHNNADTLSRSKAAGKAAGITAVKTYLGYSGPVAAVGDSDQDIDMLSAAEIAYAPANASAGVQNLVRQGKCRRTRRALQSGLLDAAMELARNYGSNVSSSLPDETAPVSLIDRLLKVPDISSLHRFTSGILW